MQSVLVPATKMDGVRQLLTEGIIDIHEIQRRLEGRWGFKLTISSIASYKCKITRGYADRDRGKPTLTPREQVEQPSVFVCIQRIHTLVSTFGLAEVEQAMSVYKQMRDTQFT